MTATKVNAGLAESNDKLLLGIWRNSLHVTCGLTACIPGSAPGPTLGNEYGKTLPLPFNLQLIDYFRPCGGHYINHKDTIRHIFRKYFNKVVSTRREVKKRAVD